jgi:hypothetical protein
MSGRDMALQLAISHHYFNKTKMIEARERLLNTNACFQLTKIVTHCFSTILGNLISLSSQNERMKLSEFTPTKNFSKQESCHS